MNWKLKFLKNALFGLLPYPEYCRRFKRRFIPYDSSINELTVEQGIQQVEMLNAIKYSTKGKTLLEIGTGWQPIIPIIFYLSGCKKIISIDKQKLLDKRLLIETSRGLLAYKNKLSERLKIPLREVEKKLEISAGISFDMVLDHFNMQYMAPQDIRNAEIPHKSIDIIISRAVLEHIPPRIICDLLKKFYQILRDDGKMCHIIDNSDHWEHNDKSISRLNFIKFNDRIDKIISSFNPLDYQNRLRHYEYIDMLKEAGFIIDYDKSEVDKNALDDLKHLRICKKYQDVQNEKLAILTSYIVASKI